MGTIADIFKRNLVRLRANRTQEEIAERAKIPLRSYQRAEYGDIPHGPNMAAIASALGVSETRLFLDPELDNGSLIVEIVGVAGRMNQDQLRRLLRQARAMIDPETELRIQAPNKRNSSA